MHSYRIEDTNVLKPVFIVGFILLEAFLLVGLLAFGIMVSASISSNLITVEAHPPILDEALRAVGASAIFMILSGYLVSVVALTVIFRTQLLSRPRASWLVLLFVLHAGLFLFYLRAPGDFMTSVLLIVVGICCVVAVTVLERLLLRRWLASPSRSS